MLDSIRIARLDVAWLFALCALTAIACGKDEREAAANGGVGGHANAMGGASSSTGGGGDDGGGRGGTGATSGAQASGGMNGGIMGSGGTPADAGEEDASAAMHTDAGDRPTLPAPSLDCTERFDTEHCVSARGELNGVPFDITCTSDDYGFRMRRELNEVWSIACEDFGLERRVEVWVPIAAPGPFSHDSPPVNNLDDQAMIQIASPTRSAQTGRDNLEWMLIEGQLNLASHNPILTGTFQARFGDTGDICDPASCPSAWVSASFRSVFDY